MEQEVPAHAAAVEVALRAAWYDVPVEVVGQHGLDSRRQEVPGVAAVAAVVDAEPTLGIQVAAVDLAEFLDRDHNSCSRSFALSTTTIRATHGLLSHLFFVMILLPVGYHYVIFQEKRCRGVSSG